MAPELNSGISTQPVRTNPVPAEKTGKVKRPFSITIISLIAIGTLLVGVVIYVGPRKLLESVVISLTEDTAYSPGYSESAFEQIAIGDTEANVRGTLGLPLREWSEEPFVRWLYAPEPSPEFEADGSYPDIRFSFTTIEFGQDRTFVDAFGQISQESSTTILGSSGSASFLADGSNTLSLTQEEIDKLKNEKATPEQIEARFGKPRAIFESRVVNWLQYSFSPGSTDYRQRLIGLDRDGRVCRKVNDIYWD